MPEEGRPHGKLWIEWPEPRVVDSVHMLSWASPRHAPQDYVVGLILLDGTRKQLAEVHRKLSPAEANGTIPAWGGIWSNWQAGKMSARGIYLDVMSTIENVYGPVVYEFQARGEVESGDGGKAKDKVALPSEVRIDLGGAKARAIHCLGQVYEGPALKDGEELAVGEYVIEYQDGEREAHPLIAGRNVAPIRYGNFVPEAELAFAFRDPVAAGLDEPGTLYYHVGEQAAVAPYRQLMTTELKAGASEQAACRAVFPLHASEGLAHSGGGDAASVGAADERAGLWKGTDQAISR